MISSFLEVQEWNHSFSWIFIDAPHQLLNIYQTVVGKSLGKMPWTEQCKFKLWVFKDKISEPFFYTKTRSAYRMVSPFNILERKKNVLINPSVTDPSIILVSAREDFYPSDVSFWSLWLISF